ncbi:MAG: ABC transporter permease [Ilumatobacteraceae bacterium]
MTDVEERPRPSSEPDGAGDDAPRSDEPPPLDPDERGPLGKVPIRGIFAAIMVAVVAWYLFLFDSSADNNVAAGLRDLWNGVRDIPMLVTGTEGYTGWWEYVTVQEGWGNIFANSVDHIQLVAMSMLFASIISVVLGIVVHRVPALSGPIVGFSSILLTIPALALFAVFLSVPGIGIGDRGPIIALMLYSILPILRNTVTGVEEVDRAVIESAKGMGLNARQRLIRIELPLAWPVILTGIRVATLLNIGIAAIAPLVGGSGLGGYVRDGLQRFPDVTSVERMWTGVVFTIVLALIADLFFTLVRRLTTSKGLRS